MSNELGQLLRKEGTKNKNLLGQPGFAEGDAFSRGRHCKSMDPQCGQGFRDRKGAVPIRVCLEDRKNVTSGGQPSAHRLQIVSERRKVDDGLSGEDG